MVKANVVDLRGTVVKDIELDGQVAVALGGLHLGDVAGPGLDQGRGRDHAVVVEQPGHAQLPTQQTLNHQSLISISTPAGTFRRISASTVLEVGSNTSINRLWVRISNCSRLFLST